MFGHHPGIGVPVVFAIGLGIGLACGIANGFMVAVGRVPSLVVTLYIIRGIDILIVGGNEVTAQTLPDSFTNIPRATILGIPYLAIAIAVVIGIGANYLPAHVPLRPRALRDRVQPGGGPAGRHRRRHADFTAFTVSGGIAGLAGVLWAAQYQTIDSTAGTGCDSAEAQAAWTGLGMSAGSMCSSASRWAARAPRAVSSAATVRAVAADRPLASYSAVSRSAQRPGRRRVRLSPA